MISSLKFARHFGRNNNSGINNFSIPYGLRKRFYVALPSRTYHRIDDSLLPLAKNNVAIGSQKSSTLRFLSSAFDKENGNELVVNHDPNEQKFFVEVAGTSRAYIEYERKDELIILKHTNVPTELGCRGIGKILAKTALEYVANNDLQLEIQCSFVRKYVSKYEPKYIKYIQK